MFLTFLMKYLPKLCKQHAGKGLYSFQQPPGGRRKTAMAHEASHMTFGEESVATGQGEALQDARRAMESDLVRRVKSGDQDSFRELVERHESKVFSVIHGILRNREDTEDIAQQVFTKVYLAM